MPKPIPQRGEVWRVDLGMAAKVRSCLILTNPPADDELALLTIVPYTTSIKGNRWEFACDKSFLGKGAFHLQNIQSVSLAKFDRRIGLLSAAEMADLMKRLAERLELPFGDDAPTA